MGLVVIGTIFAYAAMFLSLWLGASWLMAFGILVGSGTVSALALAGLTGFRTRGRDDGCRCETDRSREDRARR